MLSEHKNNLINIAKWFVLATLIGVIVGILDALFLSILDKSIAVRNTIPFFYLGLPFALFLVAILAKRVQKHDKDYSTDAVINKINAYQPISFVSLLKGFVLSIVTIVTGGSAGKEAPCADVGAGIASIVARLLKMNKDDQRKMMICGVSAGFAGVFGVPISGALFGLEVLWVGHIFYEVMFPALVAGITAFQVTSYLGVNYIYHPLNFIPVFSEQFFLKMILAGILFGLVSLLFIEITKFIKVIFRLISSRLHLFWTCFIGGVILIAIGHFISPLYLGLGMAGIDNVLAGEPVIHSFGFFYKIITTAITFAVGGVGGVVTPIFFVGAQVGSVLSAFLQVDPATLAALGLVAVLAGTANTPLAASVMAIELFGPSIAPYATVACVISFLVTGQQSLYASQQISWDSGKVANQPTPTPRQYGRRATDRNHRAHVKKNLFKKVIKEITTKEKK